MKPLARIEDVLPSRVLPPARAVKSQAGYVQPWVIPAGSQLPQVVFRGLLAVGPLEGVFNFSGTQPIQLFDAASIFRSRRYCQQFWIYGIKQLGQPPVTAHTPNANNAFWGWSASSLINTLVPYGGGYSGLISPVDGQIFDLSQIWFSGVEGDGLYLLAY